MLHFTSVLVLHVRVCVAHQCGYVGSRLVFTVLHISICVAHQVSVGRTSVWIHCINVGVALHISYGVSHNVSVGRMSVWVHWLNVGVALYISNGVAQQAGVTDLCAMVLQGYVKMGLWLIDLITVWQRHLILVQAAACWHATDYPPPWHLQPICRAPKKVHK